MVDWGNVLKSGIEVGLPAAFKYLQAREDRAFARDLAKTQASGTSFDTMAQLLTLGASLGGARQSFPEPVTTRVPRVRRRDMIPLGGRPFQMPTFAPRQLPPGLTGPAGAPFPGRAEGAPYVQQAGLTEGLLPMIPQIGQGIGSAIDWLQGQDCPQMFVPTQSTIRARHLVQVQNPQTGTTHWYRNVGRPILFSGDLRAAKRVRKVASMARRASPRKRTYTRKR